MTVLANENKIGTVSNDLFKKDKRESAVEIVISTIRTLLIHKKLRSGEKLPTELVLADSLNVSRTAVREAMKVLSAVGVVDIIQGDGTYIARQFSRKIFDPLIFSIILDLSNLSELVELRNVIECDVVRLVMSRSDPGVYKDLRSVVDAAKEDLSTSGESVNKSMEWDIAFHEALGNATGNRLLSKIYDFLIEIFLTSIHKNFATKIGGKRAYEHHYKLIDAMESGEVEKAYAEINESTEIWAELFTRFSEE